ERNEIRETKPENIILSVDTKGNMYWNDLKLASTTALIDRLKKIAVLDPQPRQRRLQLGRQDHLCVPARRHREGRLHHGAPAARRLTPNPRKLRYGNERGKLG